MSERKQIRDGCLFIAVINTRMRFEHSNYFYRICSWKSHSSTLQGRLLSLVTLKHSVVGRSAVTRSGGICAIRRRGRHMRGAVRRRGMAARRRIGSGRGVGSRRRRISTRSGGAIVGLCMSYRSTRETVGGRCTVGSTRHWVTRHGRGAVGGTIGNGTIGRGTVSRSSAVSSNSAMGSSTVSSTSSAAVAATGRAVSFFALALFALALLALALALLILVFLNFQVFTAVATTTAMDVMTSAVHDVRFGPVSVRGGGVSVRSLWVCSLRVMPSAVSAVMSSMAVATSVTMLIMLMLATARARAGGARGRTHRCCD